MLRSHQQGTLRCGNQLIELKIPVVMGILNVTPDSFYPPSRVGGPVENALHLAETMLEEGATIIDIGGMSTRPGAQEIPVEEEIRRVVPVIEAIHARFPQAVISVDTYRAQVAMHSLHAGATLVNDVSGGQLDQEMWETVASSHAAYVLMHMKGTPVDMQYQTSYNDLIGDMVGYFVEKIKALHQKGVRDIIIDPGFGFAKTMEQNYRLIERLHIFQMLGCPVMIGLSRKSTLSRTIGRPVEETLDATTALHMVALRNGALILRAHDVRPAMDVIKVFTHLRGEDLYINKTLSQA